MEASDEIQQLKQLLEIDSEMKKGEKKKKKKKGNLGHMYIGLCFYSHLEFLKVPYPTSLFLHRKGENTRQQ